MAKLELTEQERETLAAVLDYYLTELRGEISDTDNWSFKDMLKKREGTIRRLLGRLGHPVKPGVSKD